MVEGAVPPPPPSGLTAPSLGSLGKVEWEVQVRVWTPRRFYTGGSAVGPRVGSWLLSVEVAVGLQVWTVSIGSQIPRLVLDLSVPFVL